MNNKRLKYLFLPVLLILLVFAFFLLNRKVEQKKRGFAEKKGVLRLKSAEFLYDKRKYSDAMLNYLEAADFFLKAKNPEKVSYCFNCAGLCYRNSGKDSLALENYFKALSFSEDIKDRKTRMLKQAAIMYNMAVIFDSLKFFNKALDFYVKAQKNYFKLNMMDDYYYSKVDIAVVYRKLNKLEKAIEFQQSAYNYFKKRNDRYYLCLTANNLAYSLLKNGDFAKSEKLHKEALSIAERNNFKDILPYIYSGLGELYFSKGNYDKSLYYQKLAEKMADKNDLDLQEYILNAFSKLYFSLGNRQKAAFYLKKYNELLSGRYNSEVFEKIEKIIRFMERERHKQKLALLEKEKRIRNMVKYLFLFAFLTGFAVVLFLSYRYSVKKRINRYLDLLARKDPLTNLSNRRDMMEKIEREILRFQRNEKGFSIAICDIDDFKKVNDTYGHAAGDLVLKKLADVFRKNLRKTDGVARWGGEEFLFLFPETDVQTARDVLNKLRKIVEEIKFTHQGKEFKVTVTFGLCFFDGTLTVEKVIELADKSLYRGKNAGKNRVEVCKNI